MTLPSELTVRTPHRGRAAAGRAIAGPLAAVVLLAVPSLVAPRAAGADPISDTQSQVAALRAQITAGGERVHQLTESFVQANLRATQLAQEVVADDQLMRGLRTRVDGTRSVLLTQALRSYTGQSATDGALVASSGAPEVRAEYLSVASGDLGDSVDQYRTQRRLLGTAEDALRIEQSAGAAAARAASRDRDAALADAAREESELGALQSRLAQLEASAAAAAEAAAAARSAAAQVAAVRPAATTQGGPVANGLVRAVASAVGPAPTTIPTSPTTSPVRTPTTLPAPPVTTPPTTGGLSGGGSSGVWLQLRECESGDNYSENSGNGFYGAYQFSASTWTDLGLPGRPDQEPAAMQDQAAMTLQSRSGWGQWPACAAALGLS